MMKKRWIARWWAQGKHQQLVFESEENLGVVKVDFRLLCLALEISIPEEYHLLEVTTERKREHAE